MGVHHLWTFLSYRIQLLRQRVTKMCMYLRPSCPDRPFSKLLGYAKINTQIHKVSWGRSELRGQPWSLEGRGRQHQGESNRNHFWQFEQFNPLIALMSLCRILCMLVVRRGVNLLEHAAKREANSAHNEKLRAWK
jgi:hypothetical protein